jgi:hypothetical protein
MFSRTKRSSDPVDRLRLAMYRPALLMLIAVK